MSDELLNFEEYRRRREENASTVRCAKCGEWIVVTATKCPACGVNFQGEAQDFADAPESSAGRITTPRWIVAVVVLAILVVLAGVAGLI